MQHLITIGPKGLTQKAPKYKFGQSLYHKVATDLYLAGPMLKGGVLNGEFIYSVGLCCAYYKGVYLGDLTGDWNIPIEYAKAKILQAVLLHKFTGGETKIVLKEDDVIDHRTFEAMYAQEGVTTAPQIDWAKLIVYALDNDIIGF